MLEWRGCGIASRQHLPLVQAHTRSACGTQRATPAHTHLRFRRSTMDIFFSIESLRCRISSVARSICCPLSRRSRSQASRVCFSCMLCASTFMVSILRRASSFSTAAFSASLAWIFSITFLRSFTWPPRDTDQAKHVNHTQATTASSVQRRTGLMGGDLP